MKLVIQTQVRENYGAHDWDREDYWEPGIGGKDESYVMAFGGERTQYSHEYFTEVDAA